MRGAWRAPVRAGGVLDRFPIAVPAACFLVGWLPYLAIFFRKTIAFGDVGAPVAFGVPGYWILWAVQTAVCVISHSLTLRTILRFEAPVWLVWGSIAFFSLSPTWGLLTAADIRHPLFAAVFCVFVSSLAFALFSRRPARWTWVQLAGGALAVCLLRADGPSVVLPCLALEVVYQWKRCGRSALLARLSSSATKRREARWSDVDAAFLVLAGVGLLSWAVLSAAGGPVLGEPSFGVEQNATVGALADSSQAPAWLAPNLAGTLDVAGVMPWATVEENSLFAPIALKAAHIFWVQQRLPLVNLTFSWMAYVLLLVAFVAWALAIALGLCRRSRGTRRDVRPLLMALPLATVAFEAVFVPGCGTLRFILPFLAAQPMLFAACFLSTSTSEQPRPAPGSAPPGSAPESV